MGEAINGWNRKNLFLISKVWKTHLRRDDVLRAAEGSLKRLKTDYLDCYLYHQVEESVPLEETIGAMNELVRQGMVRQIGVSNFSADRLKRAMECSEVPIAVNQVHCSLAVRDALENLHGFCRKNGIILQAWRPLRDLEETEMTKELCRKYGITFAQLALAWLLNQDGITAITAMKTTAHLQETMDALNVHLELEDWLQLDQYPFRRPCTVPLK